MTENKETKKKQPKVAALPIPSEIKLNVNWGGLASELRNFFEEYRDKITPASVTTIVPESIKEMSLDSLMEEVNNRLESELGYSDSILEDIDMGVKRNPLSTFKETFAAYGFPSNVIVYNVRLSSDNIYAYIDGKFYCKRLDKEDLLLAYEEGENVRYSALAYKLFPKYLSEEVFKHSFWNYSQTQHDYSKYTVPEGVKIENPIIELNKISAQIDGVSKTAELLPADYIASLCFGEDGYRKPKATLEQLIVKYFLTKEKEDKPKIHPTAEFYVEYLRKTLSDMQDAVYSDFTTEWLTVNEFVNSLHIKDNKISGYVTGEDRSNIIKSILLSVKYMFCKEYNVVPVEIPEVGFGEIRASSISSEEQDGIDPMVEEQETVRRSGRRR